MKRLLALLAAACMLLSGCEKDTGSGRRNFFGGGQESSGETQPSDSFSMIDIKTGVYEGEEMNDSLTVHEINGNTVLFSAFWYRIGGINYATAEMSGNTGSFLWTVDRKQMAAGKLELCDDEIALILTESQLPYIEPGIYTYQYVGSEEDYRTQNEQDILLMNGGALVWKAHLPDENDPACSTTRYLQFREDGTYVGIIEETVAGDGHIKRCDGHYIINGDVLWLGEDSYVFVAESTGDTYMGLRTLGYYEMDFGGDYSLEESQYFVEMEQFTR